MRQSLAWLAWCRHRCAPCGVAKVQLCLTPLSCAAWQASQATLRAHVSVLAQRAAPAQSFSHALRAAVVWGVRGPPTRRPIRQPVRGRAALRRSFPAPAARPPCAARCARGTHEKKPSTTIHGHLRHKCREGAHPDCTLHFQSKRMSSRGARDRAALHRMTERALSVAVKGSLRRAQVRARP